MSNNIVFSGSLLFLSLADVFQLLGGNNCTGLLTLRSPYSPEKGVVYFVNGNPVNGFWGSLRGIDAVYALFGITDGRYDFSEERPGSVEKVIRQSMMEIVLDALRLIDDGKIARLGPPPLPDAGDEDEEGEARENMAIDSEQPVKGPPMDYRYATMERSYADGATIVREGEHGKWLWGISDGTVKIVKNTPKGALTLARLGEGCFLGTVRSFLYGEYARNATAIAEGDVQLFLLDAEALHREYSALSEPFRKILISLDNRLRMINQNAIEAYIGEYSRTLPPDKVFEHGFQSNTDLYLIREGTADVIGKGPRGEVNLLQLGPDDVFGRLPFMAFGHEPLYASVMTSDPFDAELLDSAALQKEYDALSPTFRNFVFGLATNISMTTKLFYQLLGSITQHPQVPEDADAPEAS
jgi:CRP-like cAMP-binding protein